MRMRTNEGRNHCDEFSHISHLTSHARKSKYSLLLFIICITDSYYCTFVHIHGRQKAVGPRTPPELYASNERKEINESYIKRKLFYFLLQWRFIRLNVARCRTHSRNYSLIRFDLHNGVQPSKSMNIKWVYE